MLLQYAHQMLMVLLIALSKLAEQLPHLRLLANSHQLSRLFD